MCPPKNAPTPSFLPPPRPFPPNMPRAQAVLHIIYEGTFKDGVKSRMLLPLPFEFEDIHNSQATFSPGRAYRHKGSERQGPSWGVIATAFETVRLETQL